MNGTNLNCINEGNNVTLGGGGGGVAVMVINKTKNRKSIAI